MRTLRRLAVTVAFGAIVMGCTQAAAPTTQPPTASAPPAASPSTGPTTASPTPASSPAGSSAPFAIRTPAEQPQACMDALIGGTIIRAAATGLGLRSADGTLTAVEWPFGYTARIANGKVELLDETGQVVAREGDDISVGGGFGNDLWHACGPVTVALAGS